MCKVPTTISPIVIRLPHLQSLEGVAYGLRADVNQTASARGHRMTDFRVGDSHCMNCGMTVSVYYLHRFKNTEKGLAYKGKAIDRPCPGRPSLGHIIFTRVAGRHRPKGART